MHHLSPSCFLISSFVCAIVRCEISTSTIKRYASRIFSSNSSRDSPWLNTPGTSFSLPTYQSSSIQYSNVKSLNRVCFTPLFLLLSVILIFIVYYNKKIKCEWIDKNQYLDTNDKTGINVKKEVIKRCLERKLERSYDPYQERDRRILERKRKETKWKNQKLGNFFVKLAYINGQGRPI